MKYQNQEDLALICDILAEGEDDVRRTPNLEKLTQEVQKPQPIVGNESKHDSLEFKEARESLDKLVEER